MNKIILGCILFIFSCDLPREIDISSYQLETKIEKYKEPKLNLYLILSKNLDLLQTYDGVDGDIHLILGVNKSGIIKHIRTYADIFLNKGISINMTYDQFVEKNENRILFKLGYGPYVKIDEEWYALFSCKDSDNPKEVSGGKILYFFKDSAKF